MKFIATCVSGLQEVAAAQLAREGFDGFVLADLEDGMVAFETERFPPSLGSLRYVNNVFEIVAQHRLGPGQSIDGFLRWLVSQDYWHRPLKRSVGPRERTYRLMLSNANELVAGDRLAVARLCGAIEAATGLAFNGRSGDAEFWAMTRVGGDSYLGKRITRHNATHDLAPGALKPELATLLCLISKPQATDVFLDPFAGSGALPIARARWPYNMIFASDIDEAKMEALKQRSRSGEVKIRKNSPFIARAGVATALERIEDGFIDTVVTDPPWGQFDTGLKDIEGFYRAVMREMVRVVKPGGTIVMLLGDRDLAAQIGKEFAYAITEQARFEILVSGKKAIVVNWSRHS